MTAYSHEHQRNIDNQCPPEDDGDLADAIYQEFLADPDKVAEADSWNDGMQSGEWYSQVERTLGDLHGMDSETLPGSDLLATLFRLAKVPGGARESKLREMAADEAERRVAQSWNDAAEARSDFRDAA